MLNATHKRKTVKWPSYFTVRPIVRLNRNNFSRVVGMGDAYFRRVINVYFRRVINER